MADTDSLKRLLADLNEGISAIDGIVDRDPDAIIEINSMLSELFMSIDGRTFSGGESELQEASRLFIRLERIAFSKTYGTDLMYVPHWLDFSTEKSGSGVTLKILKAESAVFRIAPQKGGEERKEADRQPE